jgi:hypothetical protein
MSDKLEKIPDSAHESMEVRITVKYCKACQGMMPKGIAPVPKQDCQSPTPMEVSTEADTQELQPGQTGLTLKASP